uniref:CASTOR1 N-terminal domain-containing protein n=1 Tax=Hippocampus comes TaxID=109280 RepID=A0A3Q3E834_HIPCM
MELHILEHSLKVASIEKEGIQICTHGLIKLAFLASKTRYVHSSPSRRQTCTLALDFKGS